jgi:tetratricopeptide (TPR) repeat protein
MRRGWRCLAVTLLALAVGGRPALASEPSAARQAYDQATAAFGLGHYAEAAEKYETAFSLRPDPALLYDAAQAYRLAGNRPRALELYRNYLRLYPSRQNADEARNQVAALTKAFEDEKSAPAAVATSPAPVAARPPPSPPPVAPIMSPAAPSPAVPPALTPGPPPSATLVTETPPAAERQSANGGSSRTWIWIAAGAAVLVGGVVALVVATRGDKFPDASFGTAPGN